MNNCYTQFYDGQGTGKQGLGSGGGGSPPALPHIKKIVTTPHAVETTRVPINLSPDIIFLLSIKFLQDVGIGRGAGGVIRPRF